MNYPSALAVILVFFTGFGGGVFFTRWVIYLAVNSEYGIEPIVRGWVNKRPNEFRNVLKRIGWKEP